MTSIERKFPVEIFMLIMEGLDDYEDLQSFHEASPKAAAVFASAYPTQRFRVMRNVLGSNLNHFGIEMSMKLQYLNRTTSKATIPPVISRVLVPMGDEPIHYVAGATGVDGIKPITYASINELVRCGLKEADVLFYWELCKRWRPLVNSCLKDTAHPKPKPGRGWSRRPFPWNWLHNHPSFKSKHDTIDFTERSRCRSSPSEFRPLVYAGFFALEMFIRLHGLADEGFAPRTSSWKRVFGLVEMEEVEDCIFYIKHYWDDDNDTSGYIGKYQRHIQRTTAIGLVTGFFERVWQSSQTFQRLQDVRNPMTIVGHSFPKNLRHLPGQLVPLVADMLGRYPENEREDLRGLFMDETASDQAFLAVIANWCNQANKFDAIERRPLRRFMLESRLMYWLDLRDDAGNKIEKVAKKSSEEKTMELLASRKRKRDAKSEGRSVDAEDGVSLGFWEWRTKPRGVYGC